MLDSITVCSKRMAESLEWPGQIISILDPADYAALKCPEQNILRLNFDDVEENDWEFDKMVPAQGKAILDFVFKIIATPEPVKLLIHCHAGLSRSVSIALALKEILNFSGGIHWLKRNPDYSGWSIISDWITDSPTPLVPMPEDPPNILVYKTILNASGQ